MWKKLKGLWIGNSSANGPMLRAVDTQNLYAAVRVLT